MNEQKKLAPKYQIWIDARKEYKLTDTQIQMARELGFNPKKLRKIFDDETLKLPLPLHIEDLYKKEFNREAPERVLSIEELFEEVKKKSTERKNNK